MLTIQQPFQQRFYWKTKSNEGKVLFKMTQKNIKKNCSTCNLTFVNVEF